MVNHIQAGPIPLANIPYITEPLLAWHGRIIKALYELPQGFDSFLDFAKKIATLALSILVYPALALNVCLTPFIPTKVNITPPPPKSTDINSKREAIKKSIEIEVTEWMNSLQNLKPSYLFKLEEVGSTVNSSQNEFVLFKIDSIEEFQSSTRMFYNEMKDDTQISCNFFAITKNLSKSTFCFHELRMKKNIDHSEGTYSRTISQDLSLKDAKEYLRLSGFEHVDLSL